jgi:hypothetical protein
MIDLPRPKLNRYTFNARITAALLAASPVLALGIASIPLLSGAQKLWALVSVGLTTYAALLARKAGNRVQLDLWNGWDGAPTARRLRFREGVSPVEIERRHRDFEIALGDSVRLPTAEEEANNPGLADSEYQQAARRFISKIRSDPAYPLVHAENRHYGFARNLYGLKPAGTWCAIAVLVTSMAAGITLNLAKDFSAAQPLILPVAVSTLALVLWRNVDPDFVRPSADAYADRVLEAAQHVADTFNSHGTT